MQIAKILKSHLGDHDAIRLELDKAGDWTVCLLDGPMEDLKCIDHYVGGTAEEALISMDS